MLHVFNFCLFIVQFERMDDGILIVLFELQVLLLEIIKVVVEVKAGEIVSKLALRLLR